jgi:hypothetical protein
MGMIGRSLISIGAIVLVIGVVLVLAERLNLPLGHLPGDFSHEGKNVRVYFPLGTSLFLSALVTLILYLIGRFHR